MPCAWNNGAAGVYSSDIPCHLGLIGGGLLCATSSWDPGCAYTDINNIIISSYYCIYYYPIVCTLYAQLTHRHTHGRVAQLEVSVPHGECFLALIFELQVCNRGTLFPPHCVRILRRLCPAAPCMPNWHFSTKSHDLPGLTCDFPTKSHGLTWMTMMLMKRLSL